MSVSCDATVFDDGLDDWTQRQCSKYSRPRVSVVPYYGNRIAASIEMWYCEYVVNRDK